MFLRIRQNKIVYVHLNCVDLSVFLSLVFWKINARLSKLLCPPHTNWIEGEETGTSSVHKMDAMQMEPKDIRINLAYWNKWEQLSPAMTPVPFFSPRFLSPSSFLYFLASPLLL